MILFLGGNIVIKHPSYLFMFEDSTPWTLMKSMTSFHIMKRAFYKCKNANALKPFKMFGSHFSKAIKIR